MISFEKHLAAEPWPALGIPAHGLRLPVTHQGDADGVLILLGEDTHHGGAQQQQDQGVLELEDEPQGRSSFHKGQCRLPPAAAGQLRPSCEARLPGLPAASKGLGRALLYLVFLPCRKVHRRQPSGRILTLPHPDPALTLSSVSCLATSHPSGVPLGYMMDAHPGYYRQALLFCHNRPSALCATITLLLRSSLGTLVMFLLGCTSDCCCLSPLYVMTIHVTENGKEEQVQKQVKSRTGRSGRAPKDRQACLRL